MSSRIVLKAPSQERKRQESTELTDEDLFNCIRSCSSIAETTKLGYLKTCKSFYMHACPDWRRCPNPLLTSILNFQTSKDLIMNSDNALRTKNAWAKTVRNVFHHSTTNEKALKHSAFQEVKKKWEELNKEISVEVDKISKQSLLSTREEESWIPHSQWKRKEESLRETEFGSPAHVLVGFSGGCGFPPLRGGDLGLVSIVPSSHELADASQKRGGNVLVWDGLEKDAYLLVRNHKTSKTHGTLKRPIPTSLKEIVDESLCKTPRTNLFVSPKTNDQFESEDSFSRWATRTFKKVFDGKPVTMNTARHSFISALDTHEMSTQDLEDIASLMGQSISEQRKYFRLSPRRKREGDGVKLNEKGEYDIPMISSLTKTNKLSSKNAKSIKNKNVDEKIQGIRGGEEALIKKSLYQEEESKQVKKLKLRKQTTPEVTEIIRKDSTSLPLKNASPMSLGARKRRLITLH